MQEVSLATVSVSRSIAMSLTASAQLILFQVMSIMPMHSMTHLTMVASLLAYFTMVSFTSMTAYLTAVLVERQKASLGVAWLDFPMVQLPLPTAYRRAYSIVAVSRQAQMVREHSRRCSAMAMPAMLM